MYIKEERSVKNDNFIKTESEKSEKLMDEEDENLRKIKDFL